MMDACISSGQLACEDLKEVMGALDEARAEWYNIGIELDLSVQTLETIRSKFLNDDDRLREMCIDWLRRIDLRPSWTALTKVLESPFVQEGRLAHLAQKLRDKYCHGRDEIITDFYSTPGPSPGAPPTSQGS